MVKKTTRISRTEATEDALAGFRFIVADRFTDLGNGETETVVLKNPSNSGITLEIESIVINATGKTNYDLTKNVTISSAGTSITPQSAAIGSGHSATTTAEKNGTYTGGTDIVTAVIPGGVGPRAIGASLSGSMLLSIQPDNNIRVELTNGSGANEDVSSTIFFRELQN